MQAVAETWCEGWVIVQRVSAEKIFFDVRPKILCGGTRDFF